MVRRDRGQVPVLLGTSNRNRNEKRIRNRVVRNRINWNRNSNRGQRTRLAPSLPTLTGHMTGLLAAPAQAREGIGPGQMTRLFTNSTVDRLARVPGTTDKTKYV